MQQCLRLARQAIGKTAPNPMVGAVVVKNSQLLGEGWHPGAGQPHAEVFALQEAGLAAQGATVYVSLEPCNHYGRTPPCTEALIQAGVSTVVVGMIDPDPRVSGTGIQRLRDAGIEVRVGVEQAACEQLNEAFIHRVTHQRPLGILKYAMTLDGKIATTTGHSAWVSGPASRHLVHQLRAESDAVLVGGNTVRRDNPRLTSHGVSDHNPLRVVMTRSLDLPTQANLWDVSIAPTVVYTLLNINPAVQTTLQQQGVEVINLPELTPQAVMHDLYQRGLSQIFWECGGTLAAAALKAGVIQKVMAFVAPKIIGGVAAPSPVGDLGLTQMDAAIALERLTLQSIESDVLIEGYVCSNTLDNAA
ncbi:MAG: bifunctional diaminohydroxyphosphoribosylaminopyrimidine deaminase/5-amino-6-(5-phosphoribosylamino)uracil reductase RibD [Spirulina sp. SIO3F2]|nr:bifunctional diaminohydroxyphosphoribosylaminopyrimidine deaminase/5-amino-6-(5-phosphoribosylamino)uracil reductase RibD [Spirulina sp. SIO3F2]